MRHGEAEPKSAGIKDEDRKLTEEGIALNLRALKRALDFGPQQVDLFLCSPLTRARQTAEQAIKVLGMKESRVITTTTLEPVSTPYEFYEVFSDTKGRVLAVTHQPFVSDLLSDLLSTDHGKIAMATSSIARIDIQEGKEPSHGAGTLKWLVSGQP